MISLPNIELGNTPEESIRNLADGVEKLKKGLGYILYHLDEDNIPVLKTMAGTIEENHTLIEQTKDQITLLASDVAGAKSSISVLSNQISLKVSANEVISAINLSPESISINAAKINLNGVTTMNGLVRVARQLDLGGAAMFVATGTGLSVQTPSIRTGGSLEVSGIYASPPPGNPSGNAISASGDIVADGVSLKYHKHSEYALSNHSHSGYASVSHSHSEYCQNRSSQRMAFQVYGGKLEVFVNGNRVGSATLT